MALELERIVLSYLVLGYLVLGYNLFKPGAVNINVNIISLENDNKDVNKYRQ